MGDYRHSSEKEKNRNVEVHDAREGTVTTERTADSGVEVYDRPEHTTGTGSRVLPTIITLILIVVIGVILYQVLF